MLAVRHDDDDNDDLACTQFKCFQVLLLNIRNSIYQIFPYNRNKLHTASGFQITINKSPQ